MTDHTTVRQRQLFRHLPRSLGGDGRSQPRPRTRLWRRPVDRARFGLLPPVVRDRLRSVLRLQRHRRQLPGLGRAVPELPQRDLLGDRPRRDRRVRRAGVLLQRLQAAAGADRGRQADPGVDPRHRSQAPGYPLSEAARGDSHPGHRGRHGVPPGRVEGDQRHLQRTRPAPAHGRRALLQRLRLPRLLAGGAELEGRGRRALLRRHQETAWRWARRSCSSTATWRRTSTTAASRPANWPRRCASSPRPGSAYCGTMPGCATPITPTAARACWPSWWPTFPASA